MNSYNVLVVQGSTFESRLYHLGSGAALVMTDPVAATVGEQRNSKNALGLTQQISHLHKMAVVRATLQGKIKVKVKFSILASPSF